MTTCFVSTSIPYVNASPHIGFALELVQADVVARARRDLGEDVFFLTGTDENALKNVQAAAALGITPQELCDRHVPQFEGLLEALDVSANGFIRTSTAPHHRGVGTFWCACRDIDIAYRAYTGLYCGECESFYLERDLRQGLCPIHGIPPERVQEENHFFRLSSHQRQVERLIESEELEIVPTSRKNEALAFVRQGLRDFSISRSESRSRGWGVRVPGDRSQTVYVWFDALTNYLTGLGYGSEGDGYERYWRQSEQRIHVVGKDILRFHAVYWPALLASAGLPLPTAVLAHGFLTVEGEKISKSAGNAVDPFSLIEHYGADAIRYYLLRLPTGADGDFSRARLDEVYAADLANGLGNLVRRLETLCERAGWGVGEGPSPVAPAEVVAATLRYQFHTALDGLWRRITELNQHIERHRPWELLTQGRAEAVRSLLGDWVGDLRSVAAGLRPLLPTTAERIEATFSRETVCRGELLFPRLGPSPSADSTLTSADEGVSA